MIHNIYINGTQMSSPFRIQMRTKEATAYADEERDGTIVAPDNGDGKTLVFNFESKTSIWLTAYNLLTDPFSAYYIETSGILQTINRASPDENGMFWLHMGDSCSAWELGFDASNVDEDDDDDGTGASQANDSSSEAKSKKIRTKFSGITLYDVCQACTSCTDVANIKAQYEDLKIALNLEKDINLYKQSVVDARLDALTDSRIDFSDTHCIITPGPGIRSAQSRELLMQYVTTVHMWNYVVSQTNSSTELHITPESTSGFYVQANRALPSCDGSTNIMVTCTIEGEDIEDNLSLLVLRPSVDFKPFSVDGFPAEASVLHAGPTTKQITFSHTAEAAGTYEFFVKIIAFKYVELLDADGNKISLNDIDWDNWYEQYAGDDPNGLYIDDDDDEDDELSPEVLYNLAVTYNEKQLNPASIEEYEECSRFPSRSVDGTNRWKITIKWESTASGNAAFSSEEEFYIETTRCRQYVPGILRGSKFKEIIDKEP